LWCRLIYNTALALLQLVHETTTNGHNKGNLEGPKTRDGKADQVREKIGFFDGIWKKFKWCRKKESDALDSAGRKTIKSQ
jgi:hypothetical protein